MNAWGKVNGLSKDSKVLFMSDTKSFLSKDLGWEIGNTGRNDRWAMVIEKDGTVSYVEKEPDFKQVTVSSYLDDSSWSLYVLGLWRGRSAWQALDGGDAIHIAYMYKIHTQYSPFSIPR